MKIGIFTDDYRPTKDGVVASIEVYRQEITKLGHSVYVICPRYPDFADDDPERVIRLKSVPVSFIPGYRFCLPGLTPLINRFDGLGLDIVHIQDPFGIGLLGLRYARKRRLPSVYTSHTHYPEYAPCYLRFMPGRLACLLGRGVIRFVGNRCDLNISPSRDMTEVMRACGVRRRIEILPTGIQLEKFANLDGAAFRNDFGIPPEEKMLLFAGRFGREKNIDFLIRAFREIHEALPSTRLVLAGDGVIKNELMTLTERLGLSAHVSFLPYLKYKDLFNCYAAADLFVFSSVTETQSIVVLEAMASGTPVVAVPAAGVADIMDGERGCMRAELDIMDFKNKVLLLLGDADLYRRKAAEALDVARSYSADRLASRLLEYYRELIEEKKRG